MRWHFHPMGFEASMDAPGSMIARLFDRATGETMIAIAGIPCATVMNAADVERIIEAVEDELEFGDCFSFFDSGHIAAVKNALPLPIRSEALGMFAACLSCPSTYQ